VYKLCLLGVLGRDDRAESHGKLASADPSALSNSAIMAREFASRLLAPGRALDSQSVSSGTVTTTSSLQGAEVHVDDVSQSAGATSNATSAMAAVNLSPKYLEAISKPVVSLLSRVATKEVKDDDECLPRADAGNNAVVPRAPRVQAPKSLANTPTSSTLDQNTSVSRDTVTLPFRGEDNLGVTTSARLEAMEAMLSTHTALLNDIMLGLTQVKERLVASAHPGISTHVSQHGMASIPTYDSVDTARAHVQVGRPRSAKTGMVNPHQSGLTFARPVVTSMGGIFSNAAPSTVAAEKNDETGEVFWMDLPVDHDGDSRRSVISPDASRTSKNE
jgi:hypothetical protein